MKRDFTKRHATLKVTDGEGRTVKKKIKIFKSRKAVLVPFNVEGGNFDGKFVYFSWDGKKMIPMDAQSRKFLKKHYDGDGGLAMDMSDLPKLKLNAHPQP